MKKVSLLLTILLLLTAKLFAQTPAKDEPRVAQARQFIADLMAKEKIPGFSVAVGVDGKIVWSEGFGFADLENRSSVTTKTRFRIGSISKLLTAAAAVRLYEQGQFNLDAPVQTFVPAFPGKEFEITPRQLLGHLAGIRHYKVNEYINRERYEKVSDSLKIFQDDALLHPPGSKYFYSTYGYTLLSAAIEGAAKRDFLTVLRETVLTPLNMSNTAADDPRKIVENRGRFYARTTEGGWINEPYTDLSDRWAGGGYISNPEDLVLFGSANLNGAFYKPETRALVFTSQKTADGKETGVGLGWRIGRDSKGRTIYHHGGQSTGGRAFLLAYPEQKVVVAMLANLSFARFAEGEAEKITEMFMK